MKEFRWHIAALAGGLLLLLVVELNAPHPIDWTPSFSKNIRSPYGSYLLYHFLGTTLAGSELSATSLTTFQALDNGTDEESVDDTSYVVINRDYDADDASVNRLLEFVSKGNTAFIAAEDLPRKLLDTLHLGIDADLFGEYALDPSMVAQEKSTSITFTNPSLGARRSFPVKSSLAGGHFEKFDTAQTVVLARREDGAPNFIRIGFGNGEFLLSSTPFLFTNYAIVDSALEQFPFLALSYLPTQTTCWDEYYKVGRVEHQSPLDYVLNQSALAWTYYLLLATVVLFVFVYGRRRQRIIPIITRPANTTMEFITTVGRLYFQHGDHRNLAQKKILYLLDHIQTRYGMRAQVRDESFFDRLAERSGFPRELIVALFGRIAGVEAKQKISSEELAALTLAIDNFYLKRIDS